MGTPTYTLISETVLGSAQASVTFSSIPGTYKDLVLEVMTINTVNSAYAKVQFNGDTGTNYSTTWLESTGSSASSGRESSQTSTFLFFNSAAAAANQGIAIMNIQSYANTNVNKTLISRVSNQGNSGAYAGLWRSTAAITSLVVNALTQNLQAGSTLRLWGVLG